MSIEKKIQKCEKKKTNYDVRLSNFSEEVSKKVTHKLPGSDPVVRYTNHTVYLDTQESEGPGAASIHYRKVEGLPLLNVYHVKGEKFVNLVRWLKKDEVEGGPVYRRIKKLFKSEAKYRKASSNLAEESNRATQDTITALRDIEACVTTGTVIESNGLVSIVRANRKFDALTVAGKTDTHYLLNFTKEGEEGVELKVRFEMFDPSRYFEPKYTSVKGLTPKKKDKYVPGYPECYNKYMDDYENGANQCGCDKKCK